MNLKFVFILSYFLVLTVERSLSTNEKRLRSFFPEQLKQIPTLSNQDVKNMVEFRNFIKKQKISFKNEILQDLDSMLAKKIRERLITPEKTPKKYLCDYLFCWQKH